MNEIDEFIAKFAGTGRNFLYRCSYWFARILVEEFSHKYSTRILFVPEDGHFVTRIWSANAPSKLYDVRGDVTERYANSLLESLEEMQRYDETHYERLMRYYRDMK